MNRPGGAVLGRTGSPPTEAVETPPERVAAPAPPLAPRGGAPEPTAALRDAAAPPLVAPPPSSVRRGAQPSEAIISSSQLGPGDSAHVLASLVRRRHSGSVAFEDHTGLRRIVLRDGDFVIAAASHSAESLLAFLTQRGALPAAVAEALARRVPAFGRHAGAALVANGHLRQDELWTVLRAHAEWLVARVLEMTSGTVGLEEVPARLEAEPAVFGGATGAEVFVELMRRVVGADEAIARLGGLHARFVEGPSASLLSECGLSEQEVQWVHRVARSTVAQALEAGGDPDRATILLALRDLDVIARAPDLVDAPAPQSVAERPAPRMTQPSPSSGQPDVDDAALELQARRERIQARMSLVRDGDYFAVLGVDRGATGYDVRRAYAELLRELSMDRLPGALADLREDVEIIREVAEEAYEILRDSTRRSRYRRALEEAPR